MVNDRHVSFPSSVVDRIVPSVTDADRGSREAATGTQDAGVVASEDFGQLVIEDRLSGDCCFSALAEGCLPAIAAVP